MENNNSNGNSNENLKPMSEAQRIATKVRNKKIRKVFLPVLEETITYKYESVAQMLIDKSLPLELTSLLLKGEELQNAFDSDLDIQTKKKNVQDFVTGAKQLVERLAIDPRFAEHEDVENNILETGILDVQDLVAFLNDYTGNLNIGGQEVTRAELATFPANEKQSEPETNRADG